MKLSIIILSFNTKELLASCLDSIYKNVKGIEYEVIVVDNASYDGTVTYLKHNFKKVKLIENKENEGFAKGVNRGAEHAKGDIILFLNSDAKVEKNSGFVHALELLEKDKKAAIVGGKLLNVDGSIQRSFSSFYHVPQVLSMLFFGDKMETKSHHVKSEKEVDWVSGGFLFIKKDVFDRVKGFDEAFFMYIEDMELCFRVKKLGYKILFDPQASVIHIGQGSSNRSFAIKHIYKGLLYFYKKHKSKAAYKSIGFLLRSKAYILIATGFLTRNKYLKKTYKEALQSL